MRKILSLLVGVLLLIGSIGFVFAVDTTAPTFADMPDDWSTAALQKAVANGLLSGYEEGGKTLIKAGNTLTRAEMAAIINRAFAAENKANIASVTDIPSYAWYVGDMAKAVKMGTFMLDAKMRPQDGITRQEAFTVLARAFKLVGSGNAKALDRFSDKADIASWAVESLAGMADAGYIQGSGGKLQPQASITRAEFATVMDNLVKQYIDHAGEVTEVVEGNVIVRVPGVTLKGLTVKGDLIIADGVGEGDVTLDSVKVEGRTVVRGGGENSIIVKGGSELGRVIVAKVDGVVRVFAEDGAEIEVIYVDDGSDDVIVEGTFGALEVAGNEVNVYANKASINDATVSGDNSKIIVGDGSKVKSGSITGDSSAILVDKGGIVDKITISGSDASVDGEGEVGEVAVKEGGDGASIDTPNTKIEVDKDVEGVEAGGTPVEGGQTATNNDTGTGATVINTPPPSSGGGGTSTPATPQVSAISVEPTTATLTVGGTQQLTVTFNPTNATNKNITWESDDPDVATVSTSGLVTAVAEGTATITATSNNGKTAICRVAVGMELVTKVIKTDLTTDGYTEASVQKVNYDNLTVVQDDSHVTITGKDLVKVTQADFPLEGFGNYTIPTEGISSTEFALIAWMVGDEPHIWIIGNATTEFTITWEGVDYTINVEGLDWAADIKAATEANLTAENASTEKINYDNLTVARDGYDVTISGKVAKKVQNGDKVDGFGTIEVPEGAKSKQYALIAWMVDTELHIWAVGNETETFTFTWEGLEYTVDVKGLDWYEEVTRTVEPIRADSTGGTSLESYVFANGTLTIKGPVAEIPNVKNPSDVEARWVGVNIPKPTTDVAKSGTIKLTIKEEGKEDVVHKDVTYGEGDPFLYYFGAEAGGRTLTLEIVWNATHKETLVVKYVDTTATYTVTFEAGTSNNDLTDITGATNYVASATATEGVAYTAPVLAAEKYVFEGWFTDATCTTKYVKSVTAITSDITLYAKFTEASFEHQAANGTKTYFTSLSSSVWKKGSGTITMLKDTSISLATTVRVSAITKNANFILDLGGKTLTSTAVDEYRRAIWVIDGNHLTVRNGTIEFTSEDGFQLNTGHLTLEDDVTIQANNHTAVVLFNGSTLTTEAVINSGSDFAIAGNGTDGYGNTTVNVNGGTITSDVIAIYQPQSGDLNISGGIITGSTAVYVKSGTTTISGGTMNGNGTAAAYTYNGSGANATGDALVIDNCGYPGGAPDVSITGGTFNSTNAAAVGSYANGALSPITGFITGGTFSSDPSTYLANGYKANNSGEVWVVTEVD